MQLFWFFWEREFNGRERKKLFFGRREKKNKAPSPTRGRKSRSRVKKKWIFFFKRYFQHLMFFLNFLPLQKTKQREDRCFFFFHFRRKNQNMLRTESYRNWWWSFDQASMISEPMSKDRNYWCGWKPKEPASNNNINNKKIFCWGNKNLLSFWIVKKKKIKAKSCQPHFPRPPFFFYCCETWGEYFRWVVALNFVKSLSQKKKKTI